MRGILYLGRALVTLGLVITAATLVPGVSTGATPHTVRITLVAGKTQANGGFNFDGYAKGAMTLTVPVGWKVEVEFENAAPLPHSLAVTPFRETQPAGGITAPAFLGGATADLIGGLPRGAKTVLTFVASRPGRYELACGVPGHAVIGMWVSLIVSATARQATAQPAVAAKIADLSAQ